MMILLWHIRPTDTAQKTLHKTYSLSSCYRLFTEYI